MMVVIILNDEEIFIRNHQVFPVDLTEDVWFEHISGWACGKEAGLEEDEPVDP
jgi:hypothetical protein